jgi:serine/threonine-protein kinase RsbW
MKELEEGEVEVTFPSQTRFVHMVTSLASTAATMAGFDKKVAGKVGIATDEAVTNVIRHAYKGKGSNKITLKVNITKESLILEVLHAGEALDGNDVKLPIMEEYIKKRQVGGLGLFIINKFMDEVDYLVGEESGCRMTKYRK